MKTFTNCAEKKAKQFLNLLQGYTKGIRMTAILVLLLMGVSNMWAWNPVYLIGDPTNNWSSNKTSYVISNNQDEASAYFYFAKNNYFAVYIGYYNEQAGPDSNGAEMNTGASGKQFFIWGDGANSNSAKYVGNNGIVEVHAKQKDYRDDRPWIWLTRPEIKVKHNWNGGGWTEQTMIDNSNGTYSYTGLYSGANQTNFGLGSDGKTMKYITNATLVGSPSKGNKCLFTYNSAGYKGYGTETQNTGSATITRLYTITYNGNGHTGGTVPAAIDKKHGTNITLSSSTPTRTGYTFAGWNTKQDGTGTTHAKGATYSANADVTLYAKWTANTYTVTFNKQSGTGGTNSVTATYNAAMPSATMPTRTGYTFNGYFDATSGGTKYYNANGTSARTWNKTAATTLYAQWTENKYNVVISTDGNGTTNQTGTKSIGIVGISITATPEIGSAFKHWEVTGGAKVANATSASTTLTATAAGTVTAIFEEKPATTIYLEPTGYWNSHNPQFVAHVWNNTSNADIIMNGVGEAPYKYYKAEVPYGYTGIVFFRKKSDDSELWNQTADLTIPTDNKTLYEITSTGNGTSTKATGVWKEANLVYTITLGSSMFGPYGISYNGQSYFSKDDADVEISLPYGATINFIEGQPYSDIYTGGIMEQGKVRQFNLTQPYTIERDIRFDANYVTEVPQVAYLGVPNNLTNDWDKNASYANFIWRHDSYSGIDMTGENDMATFEFEADGVKYYKFTIQPGCNKFIFQRKQPKPTLEESNGNIDQSRTLDHVYQVLTTDVNCYMLDDGMSGNSHTGYWCALPAREGDYRLLYIEQEVTLEDGHPKTTVTKAHPSDIIRQNDTRTKYSLHIYNKVEDDENGMNDPEILVQRWEDSNWITTERHMVFGPLHADFTMAAMPGRRNAAGDPVLRYDDGIEKIKNDTHADNGSGVWNFIVTREDNNFTGLDLTQTERYTGDYYIRTNAAFGAWNSYKGSDNHMTRSDVSKQHSNYSHYYCKWIDQVGTNVTYTIANDFGMAISDTLTADETTLWGEALTYEQKMVKSETLPAEANVRFSWNEKTNGLHRAYLAGSSHTGNRFLILSGESSDYLRDEDDQLLTDGGTTGDRAYIDANEEIFADVSNWVYFADVHMRPNANVKITADYATKVQYFIGKPTEYCDTILQGEADDETRYLLRLLYDFKTNELISAYVPGGQAGGTIGAIETNLMLIRVENNEPKQLAFSTNNMKEAGKQAYGVLELTKATLEDNDKNVYERSLYWVSFPFDVRATDIFGFGEYGKHWIIQSYNGAKRAANGLFLDSDTNWEYHFDPQTINTNPDNTYDVEAGVLKAGLGYVIALDLDQIKADNIFKQHIKALALYFPSKTTITGDIVNTTDVTITIPEHQCNIIRPTPQGDRTVKDSHWNVIGVPSYINAVGDFSGKITGIAENVKFYYQWNGNHNDYSPVNKLSGVAFRSLNAYMVQFAGTMKWTNVLNEGPASIAARQNSNTQKEHNLRLELQQNGAELDRTFITLQEDDVTAAFDFNYDLCKIINKGANIYSLIATDRDPIEVAGNVMPVVNTTIPVGVVSAAAGEYTFAMPDGTDGIVVELIDYEANTTTNLLFNDYTVSLPKGTFENRFALSVKPDKTATSVENIFDNAKGDETSVRKFIIDGVLYMQKDGVLYDAQGHIVR